LFIEKQAPVNTIYR